MGLMRFVVAPPNQVTAAMAQQAYLSGMEGSPWGVHTTHTNGELVLERFVGDSGNLHIPWPVAGRGQIGLSTTSLMERPEPYYLPLELARGKISQIRDQQAEWETKGLQVPDAVTQAVRQATGYLGQAVQGAPGSLESAELAQRALETALAAADLLAECYAEQALASRQRASPRLPTLLGARLGLGPLDDPIAAKYLETFNAAIVPFCWRQIETSEETHSWDLSDQQVAWCRGRGLSVYGGPLIQLDPRTTPDWLCLCEGDFESLVQFASEFIQATVTRYRGQVGMWVCAGRVNTATAVALSEEEKVKLAARAVELTRTLDPDTPIAVSFDQPWAEYLGRSAMEFPPLHFADALVRADLGVRALMLEINLGYHPGGTLLRDPLELSRQMDDWAFLGVPLCPLVTVPSATDEDPQAQRRARPASSHWDLKAQADWVRRCVPLLVAKPYVQGVFWGQLDDSQPHEFPHGGLFDSGGRPKPALAHLAGLRRACLK